jgi:hypothetical protein
MARKKAKNKKEGNPIHIQINYLQARESKKDILHAEMHLLKISEILQRYRELRAQELRKKILLFRKIKSIKTELTKLEKTLPKIKMPSILKEKKEEIEEETKTRIIRPNPKQTIESELERISQKLKELESRA